MTAADADDAPCTHVDHVLVAAPFRRDALLLQEILGKHQIAATICADPVDLASELTSASVLIMSQEGLTSQTLDALSGHLAAQPNWSELPLVLLLDADHQNSTVLATLRASLPTSKLTVLQRPVRALELATAVQTAIAARRRQLQLRDHMVWQEELQRELDRRVKNALANVVAIYHLTMRQSASLQEFSDSFEGRLFALSRVHGSLVGSSDARALIEIADLVLAPYQSDSPSRIVIKGPPINVKPQNAITFALCLHELATNAAKYGALSGPQGSVSFTWMVAHDEIGPEIRLCWKEVDGPQVQAPTRRGYGTSFVRSAIRGLGGRVNLDFKPDGLVCDMELPLAAFAVGASEKEGEAASARSAKERP